MDKATADKIKSDGFLKSMLPGSKYREVYADKKKPAAAGPIGSANSVNAKALEAAGMKNGGAVKVGKGLTPYKCK